MFPFGKASQQQYNHIPDSESGTSLIEKHPTPPATKQSWLTNFKLVGVLCAFIITIGISFSLGYSAAANPKSDSTTISGGSQKQSTKCTNPSLRREWRTLSSVEKKEYLDAVQCFIDTPSMMGMNGTLYDDFSWTHQLVAHSTHGKAPFLTWHRRFIFVYEKTLQQTCGFNGTLPYWDWTLDWEDPTKSPIFDTKLGFGGDGNPNGPEYQGSHCVDSAPLKNLNPQWWEDRFEPHCLIRNFEEDWFGHYVNPEAIEKVMNATTYAEFFLALEMGPHDIVPMGVRGDMSLFTAPNDPIFYLHHGMLDRIWYLWQQRDKLNRVHDYGGKALDGSDVTLTNILPLAGLDKDVTVQDIMDTEAGEMCYRYMES